MLAASGHTLVSIPYWEWPVSDGTRVGRGGGREDGMMLIEGGTGERVKCEEEGVRTAGRSLNSLDEVRMEYLRGLLKDARCWD